MNRRTVIGVGMICLTAALTHGATSQEQAKQDLGRVPGLDATAWDIPTSSEQLKYRIEEDAILGRDVLVQSGPRSLVLEGLTSHPSGVEVSYRLRLESTPTRNASCVLVIAKEENDPGIQIALSSTAAQPYNYQSVVTLPQHRVITGWNLKPYPVISPVMDAIARAPLEEAMAEAPEVAAKWIHVRCRTGDDTIRIWIDDRLLVDTTASQVETLLAEREAQELAAIQMSEDAKTKADRLAALEVKKAAKTRFPVSGRLELSLSAGTRLAELRVKPVAPADNLYETVALDGYVNDRNLLGQQGTGVATDALSFGSTVKLSGVPIQLVDRAVTGGADHLDIGRSLLRQANWDGYHPTSKHRFIGTSEIDPARIQLRIPNGRYDAMYVLAAFDEEPDNIAVLSASFYRPGAGFAKVFETTVPSYRAQRAKATPLPVALENREAAKLWLVKIPLSPESLASFADMDMLEVELTKKVHQYRSYPDPYLYGWHQGGLPSGVHVYAVTLHRPEIHMTLEPKAFGHVWTAEQEPGYMVTLQNRGDGQRSIVLTATVESYDGEEKSQQVRTVSVAPGATLDQQFAFAVKKYGIHTVKVTMQCGASSWRETRNFCRLAPDTRAVKWTEGEGPLFGYWSYNGGHHTAPGKEILRLMTMAGARAAAIRPPSDPEVKKLFEKHAIKFAPNPWPISPQWQWAAEETPDSEKYEAYKTEAVDKLRNAQGDNPDLVAFYPEPHISRNLTAGNLPSYWGEPAYSYNEDEQKVLRVFFNTSKAAAEGVRAAWPQTKILIPWGDPLFIVPLLRAGFPTSLIDGSGLDMIGFERLPEQQLHQMSTHRLYMLKEEYRKFGIEDPLLPYFEGIFVPTEPGACTWQEQANYYHRWTLLSLAYGIERFYSGWFAFDCGSYYGAEHYGGCGIQRRIPYNDPKPGYAHYATMTRMLERADFDSWLPTGSHSTYCLKFRRQGKTIYALWTLRGRRAVHLALPQAGKATITDSMDNAVAVDSVDGVLTVMTSESPVYVTGIDAVDAATLGEPDHSAAVEWARERNQETWDSGPVTRSAPVATTRTIANPGDGSWTIHHERDEAYETNNYDTQRYLGKMSAKTVSDPERRGPALAVHLEKQDVEHKLMPWYAVVKPASPVTIPGRSSALGMWVKAHSDWGRIIYSLRDARGERWISIGTQDQWNCDDIHSWSAFNFDGWRYLHFETPSNAGYDAYRSYGNTWWRHAGGDGVVDLPLSIEKIIIERRTHLLYVNDIQPTDPSDVLLADIEAEYATDFDATDAAVMQSRIRLTGRTAPVEMPNPIADMTAKNELTPTRLLAVRDPDWGYDGTRCHVDFDEVADASDYQIWVAAHEDGRGAQAMGQFTKSGELLQQLRPAVKLHLWVTYKNVENRQSLPSNRLDIELVDSFGQK